MPPDELSMPRKETVRYAKANEISKGGNPLWLPEANPSSDNFNFKQNGPGKSRAC